MNLSLIFSITSAVELAYIGAPTQLQSSIHQLIPPQIKSHLLLIGSLNEIQLWIFITAIPLAFIGLIINHFATKKLEKENQLLRKEKLDLSEKIESKSIDTYELFSKYLYNLGQKFNLRSTERVSLYMLDMDHFLCIGRYSENELFCAKPNRLYPIHQGSIGKAWELGEHKMNECPLYSDSSSEWKNYQKKNYGFSLGELNKLRMKSSAIYSKRLKNSKNETVGVIVVESVEIMNFPFTELEDYFRSTDAESITHLVDALKKHVPTLEIAGSEGF